MIKRTRAGVRPQDVGLPVGAHRRVEGLRREELAMLAGISVDYVVRLEQGRGPHPSEQVVNALARALRLEDDARELLFRLAGVEPPRPGHIDLLVRPSVLRMIDRFADLPVMVVSAKGDILAWNAMSSALHGDWSAIPTARRNYPRMRFLPHPDDVGRTPLGGTDEAKAEADGMLVAMLRQAAGRYPDDPGLTRLLSDLQAGSAEFRARWDEGPSRTWRTHTKTLVHPEVGDIVIECDTLHVPDADQALHVYSAAPGTAAAESLALLRVIGTQELTSAS